MQRCTRVYPSVHKAFKRTGHAPLSHKTLLCCFADRGVQCRALTANQRGARIRPASGSRAKGARLQAGAGPPGARARVPGLAGVGVGQQVQIRAAAQLALCI